MTFNVTYFDVYFLWLKKSDLHNFADDNTIVVTFNTRVFVRIRKSIKKNQNQLQTGLKIIA